MFVQDSHTGHSPIFHWFRYFQITSFMKGRELKIGAWLKKNVQTSKFKQSLRKCSDSSSLLSASNCLSKPPILRISDFLLDDWAILKASLLHRASLMMIFLHPSWLLYMAFFDWILRLSNIASIMCGNGMKASALSKAESMLTSSETNKTKYFVLRLYDKVCYALRMLRML